MKCGMSSTCLGVVGNNNQQPKPKKRISASKIWCFTINNYTNKDIVLMSSLYPKETEYICFQEEQGLESGTPHLQGVVKFNNSIRPLEYKPLKELSSGHWEKCRNYKASIDYCKKAESRIGRIFEYPEPYNINIELYDWQLEIVNIIKDKPDDRSIYWYWSKEGCKGKTTFCKWLTINHNAICLHGKGSDIRNGVLDYYNKNNSYPNLCVFPIPRSYNEEYLSYEGLENIKDMYFYSGKYEGGMCCGPCPWLFVFSNVEPDLSMCSEDRWIVREII